MFQPTPTLDDFNRADGPLGANWLDGGDDAFISGNKMTGAAGTWPTVAWAEQAPADCEAWMTLAGIPAGENPAGVDIDCYIVVRSQDVAQQSCYGLEVERFTSQKFIQLKVWVAGVGTQLAAVDHPFETGDTLALRAYGRKLEVLMNGVTLMSAVDDTHAGGGYLGLGCFVDGGQIDAFGGGPLLWTPSPERIALPHLSLRPLG